MTPAEPIAPAVSPPAAPPPAPLPDLGQATSTTPGKRLLERLADWAGATPPEEGAAPQEKEWALRRTSFGLVGIFLPFVLAILFVAWSGYGHLTDADVVSQQLATELAVQQLAHPELTTSQVVSRVMEARHGPNATSQAREHYRALATAVSQELSLACLKVSRQIAEDKRILTEPGSVSATSPLPPEVPSPAGSGPSPAALPTSPSPGALQPLESSPAPAAPDPAAPAPGAAPSGVVPSGVVPAGVAPTAVAPSAVAPSAVAPALEPGPTPALKAPTAPAPVVPAGVPGGGAAPAGRGTGEKPAVSSHLEAQFNCQAAGLSEAGAVSGNGPTAPLEQVLTEATRAMKGALLWDWFWQQCIHAFVVMTFAGLLAAALLRARQEVLQGSTLASTKEWESYAQKIRYRRARRFLIQHARWYFARTFAFALIVAEGCSYLIAPQGVLASLLGELVSDFAVPGAPSLPFWFQGFSNPPVILAGFEGFLLYATVTFMSDYTNHCLTRRLLLSLINRAVVVLLLSLMLGASGVNGVELIAFATGLVPQTALEVLTKATGEVARRFTLDQTVSFAGLTSLDFTKQTDLAQVAISSVHDLARADVRALMEEVGIDPEVLLRTVDRALLLDTVGQQNAQKLEKVPIFAASELVMYLTWQDAFADAREYIRRRQAGELTPDQSTAQGFRWEVLKDLEATQRASRLALITRVLEAEDATQMVAELGNHENVRYILAQKLKYLRT